MCAQRASGRLAAGAFLGQVLGVEPLTGGCFCLNTPSRVAPCLPIHCFVSDDYIFGAEQHHLCTWNCDVPKVKNYLNTD